MTSAHRAPLIEARHIGRVGALAFALGVGAAVAAGPGVAWAAPSASPSASESTQSSASATDSAATDSDSAAGSESGPDADGTETDSAEGADAGPTDAQTDATEQLEEALAEIDELDESPVEIADTDSDPVDETAPDIPADVDDVNSDAAVAAETVLRLEESAPAEASAQATVSDPVADQVSAPAAEPVSDPAAEPVSDPAAEPTASASRGGTGDRTAASGSSPSSSSAAPAAPAAPPVTPLGWLEGVVSQIERTLFNKTPTLAYNSLENSVVDGVIVGSLNPTDPDSEILTYTTTAPAYGAVEVMSDGTFRYTPGPEYPGHDTFEVTVSDAVGNGFHLHGLAHLLHILTFGVLGRNGHTSSATVNIGFERTAVVSGLSTPVDFQFLPEGQVAIAEKTGAIKVFEDGEPQGDPILVVPVSTEVERGIAGLALHPDYANNGYIYVAYTTTDLRNRLSRFTVTAGVGDLDSELVLAQADQPIAPNHHGGALGFGPDGALYWGLGDNANRANSQDLSTLHGKIVRLNPDGTVPEDNPFVDTAGANPLIFATGMRNPFRLFLNGEGTLLVADVGAAAFEEVNRVVAGGNYGWPDAEGVCAGCDSIDPIYAYPHGAGGAAITSVMVPNGSTFGPSLDGKVLIADYLKGWIMVLTCDSGFSACGNEQFFDPQAGRTVKLAQGPDGNIYQLTLDGMLYRIAPSDFSPPQED